MDFQVLPSPETYHQLLARYERLMEISRQLNSTLDLGTLLNRIVAAAVELTDTEEASILLVDPASGELDVPPMWNGLRGGLQGTQRSPHLHPLPQVHR